MTVGELGYICYKPWKTIRLYDHLANLPAYTENVNGTAPIYHKVLDFFMVKKKSHLRGLVNVNTTNVNVLASVFYNLPDKEYPAHDTTIMNWVNASNLAQEIIAGGPYINLSSIATAAVWASYAKDGVDSPEIVKEGAIRNAADLLTTRQNLFTIFLLSDCYVEGRGGKGGSTLASARAVAEVWRDPFRDPANGNKHKCLVRQFKILDD